MSTEEIDSNNKISRRDFLKTMAAFSASVLLDLDPLANSFPKIEDPLCICIVDGRHPVDEKFIETYVIPHLVKISQQTKKVPVLNDATMIHELALPHLEEMVKEAKKDVNEQIWVRSAFRTLAEQKIALDKVNGDTKLVVPPGTSQHHTGLAVDLTSETVKYQVGIDLNFGKTALGRWLANNSWRFGFVQPYTKGHDGVVNEDWHFFYVGVKLAELYQKLKWAGWTGDLFDLQEAVTKNDTSILGYLQLIPLYL